MDELLAAFDAQMGQGTALDRLQHFVRFHIRHHADRPEAVFIAYMELRNLTEDNFEKIEALRRAYETRLQEILSDGVQEGTFQIRDTRIAAMAVIAMLTGVNTWFREGGRLSREDVEALYWDMVRKSVLE